MIKIIHVMSDGTERDSIEGFVVPFNKITEDAYKVTVEVFEREQRNRSSVA